MVLDNIKFCAKTLNLGVTGVRAEYMVSKQKLIWILFIHSKLFLIKRLHKECEELRDGLVKTFEKHIFNK